VEANIGLTEPASAKDVLQLTCGSGQRGGSTVGHGWHGFGSGHLTTGHLGLGQGGHSPILHGLLQEAMQGGHFGTDDLRTYLDISGYGGHSVFNMYLDRSGRGGQGGTVALRTYLDMSAAGGQIWTCWGAPWGTSLLLPLPLSFSSSSP